MAMNCEDVSAQMMELLYGELPGAARARLDAHVVGCARCRAELEGFQKTRAVARRGLDEAPPARARAAIMQAAAAHLAAQARPAARATATPERVSLWMRLRARWAFPTLATVGAVAVFLVANRVFLNPERTLESHGPVATSQPRVAPAPAPVVAPGEGFEAKAPAPAAAVAGGSEPAPEAAAGAHAHRLHAAKAGRERGSSSGAPVPKAKGDDALDGLFAEPPPPKRKPAAKEAEGDRLERRFAPPPPPREAPPATGQASLADKSVASASPKKPATSVASASPKKSAALDDLLGGVSEKPRGGGMAGIGTTGGAAGGASKAEGYGVARGSGAAQAQAAPMPPPARNRAQPAPQAAPPPAPVAAMAASPASAAPSSSQMKKSRVKRADEESGADEAPAQLDLQGKDEKQKAGGKVAANETLMQRADRLFAEGRWAEAAAAYRELIRRDPSNDDADRWRRRLVAAESADTNERNADLAEKRSADAAQQKRKAAPAKQAKPAAKATTDVTQ